MRRHDRGEVDGGRPIGAADDADRSRLVGAETKNVERSEGGHGDPELGRCAEQEGQWAPEQRAEVGEGADAEEDHRRQELGLDACVIDKLQQRMATAGSRNPIRGCAHHGVRKVGQDGSEPDRNQQQWFITLADGKEDQDAADHKHHQVLPAEPGKARLCDEDGQRFHFRLSLRSSGSACRPRCRRRCRPRLSEPCRSRVP